MIVEPSGMDIVMVCFQRRAVHILSLILYHPWFDCSSMLHSLAMTGGGNHHLMTMWSTPVTSSTILYFSLIWIRSPKYTKLDVAKKVRVRILWGSLESLLGGSGRPPTFCSLSFLGVFICNSYLWIKQQHIPRSWVFFNCLHHMYKNYQK